MNTPGFASSTRVTGFTSERSTGASSVEVVPPVVSVDAHAKREAVKMEEVRTRREAFMDGLVE
jgi:hypothetical protein